MPRICDTGRALQSAVPARCFAWRTGMCGDDRSLQARDLGFHWDGDRLARKTEVACLMDGELVYYGSSPQSNREVVLVVLVVLTLLVLFLFLLLLEFFYSQQKGFNWET